MLDFARGHDPRNPQRREERYSEKLLRQRKQLSAIRQEKLRSIGARTEHVRSTYGARTEHVRSTLGKHSKSEFSRIKK